MKKVVVELEVQGYKNKTNNLETMLTVEDVMENLHIESKTTAYKLFKLESFPSIKIGRKYIVPLSAYNKWIKNVTNSEIYL